MKYRPEARADKRARLLAAAKGAAEAKKEDKAPAKKTKAEKPKRPLTVKYGINHITSLVESKKAKLVVIAHDVDPIELVVWLPTLCRKFGVPFCIVKGKSRLGTLVHKKNATAVALTSVRQEDGNDLANLVGAFKEKYNDKWEEIRKHWGGGRLGCKAAAAKKIRQKIIAKEEKNRNRTA